MNTSEARPGLVTDITEAFSIIRAIKMPMKVYFINRNVNKSFYRELIFGEGYFFAFYMFYLHFPLFHSKKFLPIKMASGNNITPAKLIHGNHCPSLDAISIPIKKRIPGIDFFMIVLLC